jgi:hypothetical protein
MDRRSLIATGFVTGLAAAIGAPALAQDDDPRAGAPQGDDLPPADDYRRSGGGDDRGDTGPSGRPARTYSHDELVDNVSDFFGVTAENAGALIEKMFKDNGEPTAYIAGVEGSGAFFFGLRYGKGLMYMKDRPRMDVYWQGPTGGFDWGANASRVFTLCYNLQYPDAIFRRFPGVEGSAYFIGGLGVNYQRAEDITLAPIRAGVGLRLGASVGYLAYSRQRNIIPL